MKIIISLFLPAFLLLTACGGGGDSPPLAPALNASPGGIWVGTIQPSGLNVIGLAAETGEFHFVQSDNVQYVGTATTSGNSISASFDGYAPFGFGFPDGSVHGAGTLQGQISERTSVSATTIFHTDNGGQINSSLSGTFSALYLRPSTLAAIAGVYTNSTTGDVVSITGSGQATWQETTTQCVGNGTVSIINAGYNIYRVAFVYGNCAGPAAVLNGIAFSGLATLDNTVSPEVIYAGVRGSSSTATFAVVFSLHR